MLMEHLKICLAYLTEPKKIVVNMASMVTNTAINMVTVTEAITQTTTNKPLTTLDKSF